VLVLSRRSHESIRIGDTIVVTVLEVRGDHVRLGIDAPADVEVHRQEVYEAIQAANTSAASPTPVAVAAAASALRRAMGDASPEGADAGAGGGAQAPAAPGGTSGAATS
jgi:carbon storage regulator